MGKFIINKGDYIDSRQFTREECERFYELAVECGFKYNCELCSRYFFIREEGFIDCLGYVNKSEYGMTNNITKEFREFIDKENSVNSVKKFSKSDFKDGMRCVHGDGTQTIVVGDEFWVTESKIHSKWTLYIFVNGLTEDLMPRSGNYGFEVTLVTDRDGTVLFKREEELKELTLQQIADKFRVDVKQIRIKE